MNLGGTIGELQKRMGSSEFAVWLAYRKKFGPMNDVRKYDRPAALIATVAARLMGNKPEMRDYMPFGKEEKDGSLEDIIEAFGGVSLGKSR